MSQDRGSQVYVPPNRPLYSQAADALVTYMAEQAYEPGAMLPSEDELARQLHVSRSTLREAMGILEKEGLVVRKHGIGTFVTNPDAARFTFGLHQLIPLGVLAGHAGSELEVLEREVTKVPAPPDCQQLFRLGTNDLMLRVQTVLRIDVWCTSYYDYFVPLSVIDPDDFRRSELSVLEYCLNFGRPDIAYAYSELHALNADEELAGRLRLPAGTAVLHMVETIYTPADEAVMRAYAYHATEGLLFRIVRQVPSVPGLYRTKLRSPEVAKKGKSM